MKKKVDVANIFYWITMSFLILFFASPMVFCITSTFVDAGEITTKAGAVKTINFFELLKFEFDLKSYQIGLIWLGAGAASVAEFFFCIWIYKNEFKRKELRMKKDEHKLTVAEKLLSIQERATKGKIKPSDIKKLEEIKNEVR